MVATDIRARTVNLTIQPNSYNFLCQQMAHLLLYVMHMFQSGKMISFFLCQQMAHLLLYVMHMFQSGKTSSFLLCQQMAHILLYVMHMFQSGKTSSFLLCHQMAHLLLYVMHMFQSGRIRFLFHNKWTYILIKVLRYSIPVTPIGYWTN